MLNKFFSIVYKHFEFKGLKQRVFTCTTNKTKTVNLFNFFPHNNTRPGVGRLQFVPRIHRILLNEVEKNTK